MALTFKDLVPAQDAYTVSQEAISFQMHSALAKGLVSVFQLGIDAYDKYTGADSSYMQDFVVKRTAYMVDFTNKTILPKLKSVVYANTNLTLKEVITDIYPYHCNYIPQGFFAVDISFGDVRSAMDAIDRLSGTAVVDNDKARLKEFETMANAFNEDSPMLKKNVFGTDKSRKIECTMYFDPVCAYCIHDYIAENLGVTRMTAEEIAAIVCHEIGHTNTLIERCRDKYYQYKRVSTAVAGIKNTKDAVAFKNAATKPAVMLVTKLQKDKMLSDEAATALIRCVDGVDKAEKVSKVPGEGYVPDLNDSAVCSFFEILNTIMFSIFTINFGICGQLILLRWMTSELRELELSVRDIMANSGEEKVSDSYSTVNNLQLLERIADEFVSRNGLSGPLANGLSKLHHYMNYTQGGQMILMSPALRKSRVIMGYFKSISAIMGMLGWNDITNNTYEEINDRLFRMAQNTIKAMKKDLPPAIRVQFISDYEAATKAAKAYNTKLSPLLSSLQNIALNLTVPSRFLRMLYNNKLSDDYKVLQDNVDALSNNKLYYAARKFQSM